MILRKKLFFPLLFLTGATCFSQLPQGFFLNNWQPRTIVSPSYTDVTQTTEPVTVAVTIDFKDTLTKIPRYIFGDNANLWSGPMSNNPTLMTNIANRNLGVLRGPGGSTSDVFFWDAMINTTLDSVPATLYGSTKTDWAWYGKRPKGWDNWTMDVDSFYKVLAHVGATGMVTVNYGYARYGTSKNPVAKAAHMAANWVRYDNGRSKFWEIGNEVFGSWEAGYRIDQAQNRDGQPAIITPTLYGQHCLVFIDSMKAAAAKKGFDIKIGVVMVESSSTSSSWNKAVATVVGDKADYYVVHSYYTPYAENSTVETILSSYTSTGNYKSYVWSEADKAGKPHLPVAMTEYNIFAVGSNQPVSHVNGMHAVLVTGEAIKAGYGATCRWDLANGWDNGNDHGLFSYNESGVPNYTPHPAFYHLYFFRKYTGDVLLNSTQTGASGVVVIPSAFSSGQVGTALVNTARVAKIVRLNIKNFKFGDRYYNYTLSGTTGEDFSRKVYVNGNTTSLVAGGPDNYATLNAISSVIGDEIRIKVPALSAVYLLVEPGTKELAINNQVTAIRDVTEQDKVIICPNPSSGTFTVKNLAENVNAIKIFDIVGRPVYSKTNGISWPDDIITADLIPGLYFINITEGNFTFTKRLVIE